MTEVEQAVFACARIEKDNFWLYSEDIEWLFALYGDAFYEVDLGSLIRDSGW